VSGVLADIRIYPIKSFDPVIVPQARISAAGALEGDRRWALFDPGTGKFLNGKKCEALHRLRARFDLDALTVRLSVAEREFSLTELAPLEAWLSSYLERPVRIGRNDDNGFPDDLAAWGPTVVSTSSLEAVAAWMPGLALDDMRRRFRANLEVSGVPAFWEDRLAPFAIGNVQFEASNPCQRCPVPARDPDTGEAMAGFQKLFSEKRQATLPPWADRDRFDHFYRFALNTRIPHTEAGKLLRVGDVAKTN
jgi:uncharacterized protein YcbX